MNVKAKDAENQRVWRHGILISPSFLFCDGVQVKIIARTICEDTGLKCKGKTVYENDWLELEGDGSTHKFLVEYRNGAYRACEDEEYSFNLHNVLLNKTCKITGNLYD